MSSRPSILFVVVIAVLLATQCSFSFAQLEGPSCPAILKELYYPASLQVTFTSLNKIGFGKVITPPRKDAAFQYGETSTGDPQNQYVVNWLTQNETGSWVLDLFVNYTIPTPQYVAYTSTEIDSTGIPKMQQDSCYTSTNQVWIHFQITTKGAPHPPTLAETFGFLLQPGNLLVTTIQGNTDSVSALTGWVVLTFGLVALDVLSRAFGLALKLFRRLFGSGEPEEE